MVESQRWTLAKVTAAVCPECHASALYRSHTTSTFEEKRKQLGHKRPYRCHACQWRGWLEDAQLRYSAEGMKEKTRTSAQQDVAIPEISLDAPLPTDRGETRQEDELREELPDFENNAQEPVSRKVSPGFHRHARHKTLACPKCAEQTLYRSRSRGLGETLRKKLTNRRPYRCHRCGWRGWLSKGF